MRLHFACLVVAMVACTTCFAAEDGKARRPNVLLIVSDDQGYGDLGCTGNPHAKTPNVDRLAAGGVTLDRFFVSPLCAPTRASLLTGRYSLRTGVHGVARGEETMRADEVTIAEVLRDAGYRTGLFGKWHNGEHFPCTPQGQGFQDVLGFNCGHWNNYFDTTLLRDGRPEKTRGYVPDVLTDAAIGFIEANRGRPFLCYVAYNTPHSPFQVGDKYFDKYKRAGLDDRLACVYGMCENIDDNVGRLVECVNRLGLRDDTIVIYMSDNGPNGARFNAGMRGVKGTLHEGGSRVPCYVSWPKRFTAARTVTQIAAHVDVFPTLLELCGVERPAGRPAIDGRSLVPLLDGKDDGWPERTLFCQIQKAKNHAAVRTQQYRLVNEPKGWALYDMAADPAQARNIAAQRPEVVAKLVAEYDKWWGEIQADMNKPVGPIEVGHAEENPVELLVPDSTFIGGLRFSGKHPNNAWLVGWTEASASVTWEVEVVRAGRYHVSLAYICPEDQAGSTVRVTAGGAATAEAVVRGTAVKQVASPDRVPREEVYEMEWASLPVGTLELGKGKAAITVRVGKIARGEAMQLKGLELRREE
jgi:arylsulfatase A-like enzyme